MTAPETADPRRCELENRAFKVLGEPLFVRGQAGGDVMMRVHLGDTQALVPLATIQREAGIAEDSADGRMIVQIRRSLAFVQFLHLGDDLPPEVLTGEASWTAGEAFCQLALAKLQYGLVRNFGSSEEDLSQVDGQTLIACVNDPAFKAQVSNAFRRSAEMLGLPDGDAVLDLMAQLAHELSFVEALRAQMLQGVEALAARLGRLKFRGRGDSQRQEMLAQTRRMIDRAIPKMRERFTDIDAQTGEVVAVLRQAAAQTVFIRNRRDELYMAYQGWKDLLAKWNACTARSLDECWTLTEETYRFLAPRFMAYQEWKKVTEQRSMVRPRESVW